MERLDPVLVTGWTKNKFVFIDKPLSEICQEIEKWYGVPIFIEDALLGQEKYTCMIKRTTTVSQFIEMLNLTTGIHAEIQKEENKEVTVLIRR